MSTVIVDYHAGNLFNVKNALDFLGIESQITSDPATISQASRILFPGVGAFGPAMEELKKLGLEEVLFEKIKEGTPFLGICVGLQLLYQLGEENGFFTGLGLIEGKVTRFQHALKIPHMGWNQVSYEKEDPLFQGIPDQSYFYFVHSFYGIPQNPQVTIASTHYGISFSCAIRQNNVWGVQFHPEKSQEVGLHLLKNFCQF